MIIDCFPFFNEIDLIEIRYHELRDVVDWFVVIEAAATFTNKPKPLIFDSVRHILQTDKVLYLKINSYPDGINHSSDREAYTRDCILEGLIDIKVKSDDVILLSDVDEIPRADAVDASAAALKDKSVDCFIFDQTLSYYYVNCVAQIPWIGTKSVCFGNLKSMQHLRDRDGVRLNNTGWHFSYMGGPARISDKIGSWSHTELDCPAYKDLAYIESCREAGVDLYGRNIEFQFEPINETYPEYLIANQNKFSHLIRAAYSW